MSWDLDLERRLRLAYGGTETARTFTAAQRKDAAKSGHAMSDGSFPIKNAEDLKNAIRLVGKAKDPGKARAHVIARARALGLTKLLPQDWTSRSKAYALGDGGFVTEVGGKIVLTAPARKVDVIDDLPEPMRANWERASAANPYFTWIQGRYVEAGKANANGAYWSTEDLQVGEMTVRHGPLNWLHDATTVIGTIADNKLISPEPQYQQVAAQSVSWNGGALTVLPDTAKVSVAAVPRPYIAAVSAVWRWVHPDKAKAVEAASDAGTLWYSMECIAREVACTTDGTLTGCGGKYDYLTAMVDPASTCEHIRNRTSARRMVDPAFLGGGVIVPPVKPGWTDAHAEVLRQAAALAEQVAPADAVTSDWEQLLAAVINYAGRC